MPEKKITENENLLWNIISVLKNPKKLTEKDIFELFEHCYLLYGDWFEKKGEDYRSVVHCKYNIIPLLEKFIKKSTKEYLGDLYKLYMNLYAFCGRRDLECFIDYMESDRVYKVLDSRREVLTPFVDSLNRLIWDNSLSKVVASFPPSYGKSFCMNYFTAWCIGMDINNSILRISYSEDLVSGFSRSIKEIISNPLFADIFPKFQIFGGKPFDKEKESDWKIKGADVITNHISRTRDGSVTGVRANRAIIIDDITKGALEATNSAVHKQIYDKWNTEWLNRDDARNDGSRTKLIIAGTMWSPDDLLNRIREDEEKYDKLVPSKKYKYTWETKNCVFIRVPALDENEQSTCPNIKTTDYYVKLKENTDPYLFSCVYQQEPIAPSGLEFSWEFLNTYDKLPLLNDGRKNYKEYCYASLDPARRGKDNVSMPIFTESLGGGDYYMVDVLFKQKAMTDLYDDIVQKIIENKVIKIVIENNTDSSLKLLLETKLKEKNYNICEIFEKFSTENKEKRIKDMRGLIKKSIHFKSKELVKNNTDYGRFMTNLTTYSFDFANKHDDAPDSLALFEKEIALGSSVVGDVVPVSRESLGF